MFTIINPLELAPFLGTLVAVIAFIFVPVVRKVAEWFVTIVHEVGHGVFSILTGGGISGIKLHKDGSGLTNTYHRRSLFSFITRGIVLFAGYATPIYLGIFMLSLIVNNNVGVVFSILVWVGVITLIFIRNFFGFFIVLTYFAALITAHIIQQGAFVPIFVTFMALLFIIRGVYDLIIAGRIVFTADGDDEENFTDFHLMREESLISIPAGVWYVLYVIINVIVVAFIVQKMLTGLTV